MKVWTLNYVTMICIAVGLGLATIDKLYGIERNIYCWVSVGLIFSSLLVLIVIHTYLDWKRD